MRYRIVFFGTPDFAVPSLSALIDGPDDVVGLVCQADRPAGRGQKVRMPPTKEVALARDVEVEQPAKLRSGAFPEHLQDWRPDLIVVAAYGRILPSAMLELPRFGCINVHASLLPKYRGAAPIQWAIARGETETGISIMQMNEEMDTGDVLLQRATAIGADETGGSLTERLSHIGAACLMEALDLHQRGELRPAPQDDDAHTLAPKIRKADGLIDWRRGAAEIARLCRAFHPWPSAFTHSDGKLLKIHRATAEQIDAAAAPGTILATGDSVDIATGDGVLIAHELQVEGRRRMPARELCRGGTLQTGSRLGRAGD